MQTCEYRLVRSKESSTASCQGCLETKASARPAFHWQMQGAQKAVAFKLMYKAKLTSSLLQTRMFRSEAAWSTFGRLARRMHRWLVSCLRMAKRKLSGETPLVPRSSAKGGRKLGGGTTHAMPHFSAWDRSNACSAVAAAL